MNQIISNVLMQPNLERATMTMTDAVVERPQRPLTLIEKLENYRSTQTDYEATLADAVIDSCIDIIKQHSDWVSVNERLPTENDGRVSWGVNAYKKYILVNIVSRGIVMTCRFNLTDKCFETADEVTHWQPMPQPPSEVQDD